MNAASDRAEPENQKDKMKYQKNETGAGNSAAHTPGPWFLDQYNDGSMAIVPQVGFTIAPLKPREGFDDDIPNARLMAVAPELLNLVKAWAMSEPLGTHADACHAAIAKAEGRPE